jgi:hypothetical protein
MAILRHDSDLDKPALKKRTSKFDNNPAVAVLAYRRPARSHSLWSWCPKRKELPKQ